MQTTIMPSLERASSPPLAPTHMPDQKMSRHNETGRGIRPRHEPERFVMRSPVPEEAINPVLLLWDHEQGYCHQSPRVLNQIETLLNLETIPWPSQEEKRFYSG